MAEEAIDVGDVRGLHVIVRDKSGAQVASNDVICRVAKPDGTSATVVHASATQADLAAINEANAGVPGWVDLTSTTGVYVVTVELDQSGEWWFRWAATSPVSFAEQRSFYVAQQRVPTS